jgi:uncharacterized cupin superfamily protein
MPKIDMQNVPLRTGTIYPAPYDQEVKGRSSLRLGDAGGLTQFGANLIILEPGAKSSMRHWHKVEDEFVMVILGEVTLIDNSGHTIMFPHDVATFKAGVADGHTFLNHTDAESRFLVVGTRSTYEVATYPDHKMTVEIDNGKASFKKDDGSPV